MILRVARHTDKLQALRHFYVTILGMEILGEFKDHDHYDGVLLGPPNADWHLEFTQSDEPAHHVFDQDDLLVFYPVDQRQYDRIVSNIEKHRIPILTPKNPYWRINGIQINDPDGHGIIISGQRIQSAEK